MSKKIYILTCDISKKQYVGQTSRKIIERLHGHFCSRQPCIYIDRAIRKYGIENFLIQEIDGFKSQEKLDKAEIYYIKALSTLFPNGYNLRSGGNGGRLHEETKRKIGKAHIGRKRESHTEETKKKISRALKGKYIGKNNHRYGIEQTEETKIKISESNMGKKHTEKSKKKMSEFRKGKSYEEFYGLIKATELRKIRSNARKGSNNPMYGKKRLDVSERNRNRGFCG